MNKTLHCSSQIKKQHLVLPSTGLHNGNTVSRKENKSPYTTKKNATSYIYISQYRLNKKNFSIPSPWREEEKHIPKWFPHFSLLLFYLIITYTFWYTSPSDSSPRAWLCVARTLNWTATSYKPQWKEYSSYPKQWWVNKAKTNNFTLKKYNKVSVTTTNEMVVK